MPKERSIKLSNEVDGYLKAVDIAFDRIDDARSVLSVGESVEAKVINVDRKNRGLGLSIKAKDIDDEKDAVASLKEQDDASSPGTIGDLIKAQMDDQ
jgi:small subunit ribosomal protein S1